MANQTDPLYHFVDYYLTKEENCGVSVEEMKEAIVKISNIYGKDQLGTNSDSAEILFHSRPFRCAYIYRFFSCTATITECLWRRFATENIGSITDWLVSLRDVNLISIGGGPATDLFAFYRVFKEYDVRINATIFDNSAFGWLPTANDLFNYFNVSKLDVSICTYCRQFDFFEPTSNCLIENLETADVISFVKFVSCVAYDEGLALGLTITRLKEYFQYLKSGALVFFIDNSGGAAVDVMQTAVKVVGLECLAQLVHCTYGMHWEMQVLHEWENKFAPYSPQMNAKITACLWRKP